MHGVEQISNSKSLKELEAFPFEEMIQNPTSQPWRTEADLKAEADPILLQLLYIHRFLIGFTVYRRLCTSTGSTVLQLSYQENIFLVLDILMHIASFNLCLTQRTLIIFSNYFL